MKGCSGLPGLLSVLYGVLAPPSENFGFDWALGNPRDACKVGLGELSVELNCHALLKPSLRNPKE